MDMKKKQAVISRSAFESISSIFYASRISGICPLVLIRKTNNFHLVTSKRAVFFSYFLMTLLVSVSIYGLVHNYQIKEIYKIRFGTTAGMVCTLFENFFLYFSCVLGTIIAPFLQHHLLKFLECLQQIDAILGFKNLNQRQKCSRILIIILTITVVFTIADISLWSSIVAKKRHLLTYICHSVPFHLMYVWQMIVELHFWILVYLIKVRLIFLNEDLANLLEEVVISDFFLKNNEFVNKKLIKVINYYDGFQIRSNIAVDKKVKNILTAHTLLARAAMAANNYFGINVLLFLSLCLVHLLVTPYILYMQVKETKNHLFIASQMIWLICHISRLIFIIEPCQSCKTQIRLTIATVCKLLSCQTSNETRIQLRSFLEQLNRCNIQFSAYGLITIDRTLLTTVTGTVTTYLVILFQFK